MNDLSEWPALVLTAGKATRLRPLSSVRAKAAMPVAGTPIIVRILQWLRAAGVRRVVMNLHHRPETITRVVGDGSAWDVRVRYSWEPEILGSAGGPRRALPLLDAERFLIVNGDTLTDCDLAALVQRHRESAALVTMAVVPGDVARYGGVVVGADGVVQGFARSTRPAVRARAASDPRTARSHGRHAFHRHSGGRGRCIRVGAGQRAQRNRPHALSAAHCAAGLERLPRTRATPSSWTSARLATTWTPCR